MHDTRLEDLPEEHGNASLTNGGIMSSVDGQVPDNGRQVNRSSFKVGNEESAEHLLHSGYSHLVSREWHSTRPLLKGDLMWPVFISDDESQDAPVSNLPNTRLRGVQGSVAAVKALYDKGLRSVIVFGIMAEAAKDASGSAADNENGPVIQTIKALRAACTELFIAADVCMCEYTSHGHCGLLRQDGSIDNQPTIERLGQIAVSYARAGADCVAPSDMNDNHVRAIKTALQSADLIHQTVLMSYSAKFTSCLYGPFRILAASNPKFGDRGKYQLPPAAGGLGRRAMSRDVVQGADIIMVKPGMMHLDVVRDAAMLCPNHPIAVFQVSGEAAMIHAAVEKGVFSLRDIVMETSLSLRRAGATILISYFTPELLDWLKA